MINELLNIDCMEYMKTCKDKQFDLAIVDPPYGIGEDGRKTQSRRISSSRWKTPRDSVYIPKNWDNEKPSPEYFTELFRVSKKSNYMGRESFHLTDSF